MKKWSFRRAVSLLVLLLICDGARSGAEAGPPAERIPLHLLFGHPVKMAPQVSPDGKLLAYLAPHCGALNVWVRTIGKSDDKPVTSEKCGLPPPDLIHGPLRTYFWQEDSQHILYTRDDGGDGNAHLYQADVHSGMTRDLTPWQQPKAELIAVSHLVPDEALVGLVPPKGRHRDVYRVNLVTGDFEGVAGCANGRRSMTSSLPFAVTVWGWGTKATNRRDVSYAYPAGMRVRKINEVPPLVEPPR